MTLLQSLLHRTPPCSRPCHGAPEVHGVIFQPVVWPTSVEVHCKDLRLDSDKVKRHLRGRRLPCEKVTSKNVTSNNQERKRHINMNVFGQWPLRWPGGSPDREARGQSFMYYPRNPRNINLFVRIPDREDRCPGRPERVLCVKVLCAFSAP